MAKEVDDEVDAGVGVQACQGSKAFEFYTLTTMVGPDRILVIQNVQFFSLYEAVDVSRKNQ